MHTQFRGRNKAATPGLARPHGRKRRPTPMVWRAGARYRHSTRVPLPIRLMLVGGLLGALICVLLERPWT